MTNLSLSDILRYLATGFVILLVAYACEPTVVKNLFDLLGAAGIPVAAFVFGSLSFLVYRPTLYTLILFRLLDFVHQDNVRHNLMKKYEFKRKMDAEVFWSVLKRAKLEEEFKRIDLDSSGVHLGIGDWGRATLSS